MLLLRVLLAATLSLAAAPAVPQTLEATAIPKVICPVPGGYSMGSAVRIGNVLISANHVTGYDECSIDGHPIKVLSHDGDFSILTDGQDGPHLTIDCNGYVAGEHYLAIGHARGLDQLTVVDLEAAGFKLGQFYALKGIFTVIPGQSGGAIVDPDTMKVVGIINTYIMEQGLSGSLELRDTSLCPK